MDGTIKLWNVVPDLTAGPTLSDPDFRDIRAERAIFLSPSVGKVDEFDVLVAPEDGAWVATARADAAIRIWDGTSWSMRHRLMAGVGNGRMLAAAPDGVWLASAGQDGHVRIWDPASGSRNRVLAGHGAPVTALSVVPGGRYLASADQDGTVVVWDPLDGRALAAVRLAQPLVDLRCIDTGHLVASGLAGHYFLKIIDLTGW